MGGGCCSLATVAISRRSAARSRSPPAPRTPPSKARITATDEHGAHGFFGGRKEERRKPERSRKRLRSRNAVKRRDAPPSNTERRGFPRRRVAQEEKQDGRKLSLSRREERQGQPHTLQRGGRPPRRTTPGGTERWAQRHVSCGQSVPCRAFMQNDGYRPAARRAALQHGAARLPAPARGAPRKPVQETSSDALSSARFCNTWL